MPRHFGILIPSTNTTCEIEFCRLAPGLQVHTGITTNQAALWAVLQTMKFDTPLPGKGRLLEQLPAG